MTLYHATEEQNLSSILLEGLQRKYSKYWCGSGGCIYLSSTYAKAFGEICIAVEVPDVSLLNRLSEWEYIYWGDIPIKFIFAIEVSDVSFLNRLKKFIRQEADE